MVMFSPKDIVYFQGSDWLNLDFINSASESELDALVAKRISTLNDFLPISNSEVPPTLEGVLKNRWRQVASSVHNLANFSAFFGLTTYCTASQHVVGTKPSDMVMHALLSFKIMDCLLDCCRADDDHNQLRQLTASHNHRVPIPPTNKPRPRPPESECNYKLWSLVDSKTLNFYPSTPKALDKEVPGPVLRSLLEICSTSSRQAKLSKVENKIYRLALQLHGWLEVS